MDNLIKPYKTELNNILLDESQAEHLKAESQSYKTIILTRRQQCDLELLLNGALSPLTGFMTEAEYNSVVNNTSLLDGTIWPIPYYIDITQEQSDDIKHGDKIALRDTEGFMPAVLTVSSIWKPNKTIEALNVYGTDTRQHPGVDFLFDSVGEIYIGGQVEGVQLPFHYDFETLRDTPAQLRSMFNKLGWRKVVAFHTSKPMHRVHQEMTLRAAKVANANILIHPVVGMSKPGDIHYYSRVHCYQAILKHYPKSLVALSLLPMAMRMAGPKETLMNAIIRQNYGCTHYIVGTEHAAPPNVRDNNMRFYPKGASQEYVSQFKNDIDIKIVPIEELCYDNKSEKYVRSDSSNASECITFSNSQIMQSILLDKEIPHWVTYPDVITAIRHAYPPRSQQGVTIFFTGLSGSGKSTLARIIYAKFIEEGTRSVTLLDGDVVRLNLSSELGFSKKDRNINVKRIGYVASEITKNRGIAICAPIAPYADTRKIIRSTIEQYGAFIEVHVSTSLEECEKRDRKGLYAKARKGIIPEFTGISDPYEIPTQPEIRINTENLSPNQSAQEIYLYLVREGFIKI